MSRDEASKLIQQHGGQVTGSVSRNTDYLVVGESPGGSKYRKAQQLETPMIDEAQLLEMIRQSSGADDSPAQMTLPLG
jgi:NAD-dependent DNA ligase